MKRILFLMVFMLLPQCLFCPPGGLPTMDIEEYNRYVKDAQIIQAALQQLIVKAEALKTAGMLQDALNSYAQAVQVVFPHLEFDYYLLITPSDFSIIRQAENPFLACKKLRKQALQKMRDIALQFEYAGRYQDALAVYKLLPNIFGKEIEILEKTILYLPQLNQARSFIAQKKYKEARNLLVPLKQNQIEEAAELDAEIEESLKLDDQIKKLKREDRPQEATQEWIFLREIDRPDKETSSWRIKDKRLELKTDAVDASTQYEFGELLQEAKDEGKPYILLGLRKGDFYYFNDGSLLSSLGNKWEDPTSRVKPDSVEVYVMGDDEKLTYLGDMKQDAIYARFLEGSPHTLHKDFNAPVGPRRLIADAFKEEARKINPKYIRGQKLMQHARQWYDWALKYLPQGSDEYNQAQQKRDAISYKPELPKEPEPVQAPVTGSQVPAATGSLMQSLRNLSIKLRGLAVKLT